MKITLDKKFKSLDPFQTELPDFVIFTGLNGAGKTQMLVAISQGLISVKDNAGNELNPKKYVPSQSLSPNESKVITREELNQVSKNLWEQYQNYLNQRKSNPAIQLRNVFGKKAPQLKIIEKILANAKKNLDDLNADDFYTNFPIEESLEQKDIFYQNFSSLFKRYQDKYDDNEYRQYRNDVKGHQEISYLTREQFVSAYGEPPWDFVNKIISSANLDYHITPPNESHRDAPFELTLVNNINNAEIKFGDLSSGEKVLMSLGLALYNASFDIEFPKVLLMDEPDASLHPSMSKQFLNVIADVFVRQKGVKVIITTHSPSTVALAPEEAIFVVNKSGVRVEKVSKDKALKILTSGVPAFSVNYENRRQVFVESPNDVKFYDKLYQKLGHLLIPEISLSFISSGESRTDKNGIKVSNSSQVIAITKTLRDAGNKFIWGIIDWDLKNKESEYVKVLGNGNRYGIENYIFDPILLAALLLREKIVTKAEVGLSDEENYIDFKRFEVPKIQVAIDFIIAAISGITRLNKPDIQKVKLVNGLEIVMPVWYLQIPGHDLEDAILTAYPALNAIKRGKEELLKLEMLNKVIDDLPECFQST